MPSIPEFLLVALVLTLTPGPATALVLRVAARDGRRAALATATGNSVGVLLWATLSAVGVSSLILASQVAYDGLKFGGALVLVTLGVRSLLHARRAGREPWAEPTDPATAEPVPRGRSLAAGWRARISARACSWSVS